MGTKRKAKDDSALSIPGVHEVRVTYKGFVPSELAVFEGETVAFIWSETAGEGLRIVQVTESEDGHQSVPGGYCSSKGKTRVGRYEVQLYNQRVYTFSCDSGKGATVRVNVKDRLYKVNVTDNGFEPKTITVHQGATVTFSWESCFVPRTVWSSHLCMKHGGFVHDSMDDVKLATSGSSPYDFDDEGIYYFQTQGLNANAAHLCTIVVARKHREHSLILTDKGFEPRLLAIEQGDKVWFSWEGCNKKHSVYMVDPSALDHAHVGNRAPVPYDRQDGSSDLDAYRVPPSNTGLQMHSFNEVGVYFFCDKPMDDTNFKLGTIVVRPKHKQVCMQLAAEGFTPSVQECETGDHVLWTWDTLEMGRSFCLKETDVCLSLAKGNEPDDECTGICESVSEQHMKQIFELGMQSTTIRSVGVHYFGINNIDSLGWASIICRPAPQNFTVEVTDKGLKPNQLTISCGDRVWFRWQDTTEPVAITQASFTGLELREPGFSSKRPRAAPSAFVHEFREEGIYYFCSSAIKEATGTIVVTKQPTVHTLAVSRDIEFARDPCIIRENEVVCWRFNELKTHDVLQVVHLGHIPETLASSRASPARACMSRVFADPGVFHYCSKSFKRTTARKKPLSKSGVQNSDEFRISTIIVEDTYFPHTVLVDASGFHPSSITIQPRQTVMWTWIHSLEKHNIVRVSAPESQKSLLKIEGSGRFTSGSPTEDTSYLQTFDDPTSYYVISEGAQGYSTVKVVKNAEKVSMPFIDYNEKQGGTVRINHPLLLACETSGVQIYFTIDGTVPLPSNPVAKKYSEDEGALLDVEGLVCLRAAACKDGYLTSDIFTSKRFLVEDFKDTASEITESVYSESTEFKDESAVSLNQAWLLCIPEIKLTEAEPGEILIDWPLAEPEFSLNLIKGYKLYINEVVYHEGSLLPMQTSLHVCGLAGGKSYDIVLEAVPKYTHVDSLFSNTLVYACSPIVPGGGPLISLKVAEKEDDMCVVWKHITATQEEIHGYYMYLDGHRLGDLVHPEAGTDECTAWISDFEPNREYTIYVTAFISEGAEGERQSNVLDVFWPLTYFAEGTYKMNPNRSDMEFIQIFSADAMEISSTSTPSSTNARSSLATTAGGAADLAEHLEVVGAEPSTLQIVQPATDQIAEPATEKIAEPATPRIAVAEKQLSDVGWGPTSKDRGFGTPSTNHAAAKHQQAASDMSRAQRPLLGPSNTSQSIPTTENEQGPAPVTADPRQQGPSTISVPSKITAIDDTNSASNKPRDAKQSESLSAESERDKNLHPKMHEVVHRPEMLAHEEIGVQSHARPPAGGSKKRSSGPVVEAPKESGTSYVDPYEAPSKSGGVVIQLNDTIDVEDAGKNVNKIAAAAEPLPPTDQVEAATEVKPSADVYIIPKITHQPDGELIEWEISRHPGNNYELISYMVSVSGRKFKEVSSDTSCECLDEQGASLVQHTWHISDRHQCLVKGLADGELYSVQVSSTWVYGEKKKREVQIVSDIMKYKTIGAPSAPTLKVIKTDMEQVSLEWTKSIAEGDVRVNGYAVMINGSRVGNVLSPNTTATVLDRLSPGQTINVSVVAVTGHAVGDSQPSNTVVITCPAKPATPLVVQRPSLEPRSVLVAWEAVAAELLMLPPPASDSRGGVAYYAVYVDEILRAEVAASQKANREGYQYCVVQLEPGASYEVTLRAVAGQKMVGDTVQDHVYCLTASSTSNILPVVCAAPPVSPHVFIDRMSSDGIEVIWEPPQQLGEAVVTGYQLFKNGQLYHTCTSMPTSLVSLNLKDVVLGEQVTLQVIALTNHPAGSGENLETDRYAQCKPGPSVQLQYTGLLKPPINVRVEKVTGHTAMLTWSKASGKILEDYFATPECYQVTWWLGQQPDRFVSSTSTTDCHVELTDLQPSSMYTVVVEARRRHQYTIIEDSPGRDVLTKSTIVTSRSEQLALHTGKPPSPPANLGVVASTCYSIELGWDPPKEYGVEVKAIRVDSVPVDSIGHNNICIDLMPDATSVVLANLQERTRYKVTVTVVTDEFFYQLTDDDEWKTSRVLPLSQDIPDSPWLPKSSIIITTSGTVPPSDVCLVDVKSDCATVSWRPSSTIGNNRLCSYIVRWSPLVDQHNHEIFTDYIELHKRETKATIVGLHPASRYRLAVEAVVSVKTVLESLDGDEEKNRRTTHVPSESVIITTRAPVQPPSLYLTGYSTTTVQLFWEKPLLLTVESGEVDGQSRCITRNLEGYRLSVNGSHLMDIDPSEQTCTLAKCKAGKRYRIALVALTKPRLDKLRPGKCKNDEKHLAAAGGAADQSGAASLDVQLPELFEGNLESVRASCPESGDAEQQAARSVLVEWTAQGSGSSVPLQWSITWSNASGGAMQTTSVNGDTLQCLLPITSAARAYDIGVQPRFQHKEPMLKLPSRLRIALPSPPEAPVLFLKSCSEREFRVEWGEPMCRGGCQVDGYQVYLNDRKHGSAIDPRHRKAVMPCKPNRYYKVHLCAISKQYGQSPPSNILSILSPKNQAATSHPPGSSLLTNIGDWESSDQTDLYVRATQVVDTSIRIEWDYEAPKDDVHRFAITWSSVVQPEERELNASAEENQLDVRGLLSGTTHFFQVKALGSDGTVVEKSRKLEVQTWAAPDPPVISLKARNFTYVSIQWERPKHYGLASVTGYKIVVDGVVKETKSADQLSHTFSGGVPRHTYTYQVVAVSSVSEELQSRPSEPLIVQWPGVLLPTLRQTQTDANASIKVSWDPPVCTDGVKVKYYKLVCREPRTGTLVQSVSPLRPNDQESELHGLRKGVYAVHLEVHVFGSDDVFKTDAIEVEPLLYPDAPRILVTTSSLDRRHKLEKLTALLSSRRYRLMCVLHEVYKTREMPQGTNHMTKEILYVVAKARAYLRQVEVMLSKSLELLAEHTGTVNAHLSWACPQTSPDVTINGYRVLLNGKQYGVTLNANTTSSTLELGLDEKVHLVSVVAVADKPYGVSGQSNVEQVWSALYQPYSSFCYSSVHSSSERWPSTSCCRYDSSVMSEKQRLQAEIPWPARTTSLLNAPLPAVEVTDVFRNGLRSLSDELVERGRKPAVLLFWTPWCLASQSMMTYLAKYAEHNSHKYTFVAFACGVDVSEAESRSDVMHRITQNSWNPEQSIWHVSDLCMAPSASVSAFLRRRFASETGQQDSDGGAGQGGGGDDEPAPDDSMAFGNLSALLGLAGVPSFAALHPTDGIAWMGTFKELSYERFSDTLTHHLYTASHDVCPLTACRTCASEVQLQGLLERTALVSVADIAGLEAEADEDIAPLLLTLTEVAELDVGSPLAPEPASEPADGWGSSEPPVTESHGQRAKRKQATFSAYGGGPRSAVGGRRQAARNRPTSAKGPRQLIDLKYSVNGHS